MAVAVGGAGDAAPATCTVTAGPGSVVAGGVSEAVVTVLVVIGRVAVTAPVKI